MFSQTTISGKITYRKNGVNEVNVTLKNTYDGTTSDKQGNFAFKTLEKGNHTLVFSHRNFNTIEKNITIDGSPQTIHIQLKEKIKALKAVVISVGSIQASDKKRAASLTTRDIYTTAGASAQITQALTFLPGTQKIGESEGLFIRGGSGNETKIFVDGSLVNHYFNNAVSGIAGRERFSNSLFKGTVFSSGGYSALYGQALSGILTLNSVDIPEKSSYNLGISPISISGNYQHLLKKKKASFGVGVALSSLSLMGKILKFNNDFSKYPQGFATNFNARFKTSKRGILKYYGSFDTNKMGIKNESLESYYDFSQTNLKGKNTFHNLSFRQKIKRYVLNLSSSYTYNKANFNTSVFQNNSSISENNVTQIGRYINFKMVLERKINKISAIRGGFQLNKSKKNTISDWGNLDFSDVISSSFLETDIGFSNHLSAKLGIRGEYSSNLKKYNVAPRLALAYRITKNWTTSFAYGIFYQNPESQYLKSKIDLDFQKAEHYIFQLQKRTKGRHLRLELFYKKYDNLIKTISLTNGNSTSNMVGINNNGNGFGKGIEVFFRDKKTIKNIDYWLSYSYLDTQRNYLNYPQTLTPKFAAKHTLSIVAKKFVPTWKTGFNLSYSFASARPYYDIYHQNNTSFIRNQGRLKNYKTLNFSVNYLPNLGKKKTKAFTVLVLSISNVLGNKNIYGYRFSNDGINRSPILPSTNTFVFVGAFISFGIDRTQEAINKNL